MKRQKGKKRGSLKRQCWLQHGIFVLFAAGLGYAGAILTCSQLLKILFISYDFIVLRTPEQQLFGLYCLAVHFPSSLEIHFLQAKKTGGMLYRRIIHDWLE